MQLVDPIRARYPKESLGSVACSLVLARLLLWQLATGFPKQLHERHRHRPSVYKDRCRQSKQAREHCDITWAVVFVVTRAVDMQNNDCLRLYTLE
jgi:hypothetical protein